MSNVDDVDDVAGAAVSNEAIAPNARRLLWAGFMAILAAGVGFALRGGILDNWGKEFGFTATQLGAIGGAGFTGFCFGIIGGGVVCDRIGYGKLVIAAFALHVLSAVVTLGATGPDNAYRMLTMGMFVFAFANGVLEAVANPLVATLYPHNRTHFLNLLHASWPAGLILGTAAGWLLDDRLALDWRLQICLYLAPTVVYGLMFLGQHMPRSEASEKGSSLADMLRDVGLLGAAVVCYLLSLFFAGNLGLSPALSWGISGGLLLLVGVMTRFSVGSFLLFFLFVAHALVGTVELGTDGWIQNITGNLFSSEQGRALFLWTSAIMFALRFCGNFVEKTLRLSPVALLLACAVLASLGLQLASGMQSFGMALVALGIYAVGKTFFWPTMLAVASDRFPRTGAVAISIMGGIGFLGAGLIGGPGLGYSKDRYAAEALAASQPATYAEVRAETPSSFLFLEPVHAIDGRRLAEAREAEARTPAQQAIVEADHTGDRRTLTADAFIPAAMAVLYLAMLLWFRSIGGYRPVHLAGTSAAAPHAA
jgi:MFS family permease